MILPNGYEMTTTFIQDFRIADMFGTSAIKDTYKRAFAEWKSNYVYLTELVISLNTLCWFHYERGNTSKSQLYSDLYYKTQGYACKSLKGDELRFFLEVTN